MNTPNNGNGDPLRRNGNGPPGDDFQIPEGILSAAHRDPDAYLEFVVALDRFIGSTGERPFTPCTEPCPLCHPGLWLNETH